MTYTQYDLHTKHYSHDMTMWSLVSGYIYSSLYFGRLQSVHCLVIWIEATWYQLYCIIYVFFYIENIYDVSYAVIWHTTQHISSCDMFNLYPNLTYLNQCITVLFLKLKHFAQGSQGLLRIAQCQVATTSSEIPLHTSS